MTAKVTIIDDSGNFKGVYELKPVRTFDYGISTKYIFEFEYNKLNDGYKVETKDDLGVELSIPHI